LTFLEAKNSTNLITEQIDASLVCSATEYDKQRTPAGVIAEHLGLGLKPTFCVESLCASSPSGLRTAYALIKSGLHETVCMIGFQKMSELSSTEAAGRMGRKCLVKSIRAYHQTRSRLG
jgi:acetyl-CoA C-acetyltransferase